MILSKMKLALLVALIVLSFIACIKSEPDSSLAADDSLQENLILIEEAFIPYEEKLQDGGTVYQSVINDDYVNVRSVPSVSGEIVDRHDKGTQITVEGISEERSFIDGYSGYWFKIQNDKEITGWVFSKYIDHENIVPLEINIRGWSPEDAHQLNGTYMNGDAEVEFSVYPHKQSNQDFWTFVWDAGNENFRYNTIPGSYVWYPETNELRRVTYIGTTADSEWIAFTDDFRYLIQQFGEPNPRGDSVGISRVEDEQRILNAQFYRDINVRGNTIEIIYLFHEFFRGDLDEELLNYGKEFVANNPAPEDKQEEGLAAEAIIVCDLNLDTRERTIVRGEYIYVPYGY
jgi:hypothetical protein